MTGLFKTTSPARMFFAAAGLLLALVCRPELLRGQQTAMELDTLRVQAVSRIDRNLPATTRSVQLLTAEEISALPVRTISEILEWATGVDVMSRSPAQGDLSIRGASFEQVVVMVNGIRMSDPQTGHFDLDLVVPLEAVERIEVLRGAASSLHGADAMGGVVNVVTRSGEVPLSANIQGGSWRTVRVSASGGVGGERGVSINAGGEVSRSDGHREGTDYETVLFHGSLTQELSAGRIAAEFGASRRDFGARDFYAPYPSFEKTRHYTASIGWESDDAGPFSWEMRLSARRHDDDFVLVREDPSLYRNQHTSSQGGATLLGRYGAENGVNVAVGGEIFWDGLNSSNLGDRSERRGALYGEALVGELGTAVLSLGMRTDWHQGFGAFFSPSLSGSVNVHPDMRFRTSLGRSFRAPTWTERYYQDPVNVGRPDLNPERAWSGELGIDLFSGHIFSLSTTAFMRRATSLIDWARPEDALDTDPWETRNVEDATFRGVETEVEIAGPLGFVWTLGGTALSVDTEEATGYRSKYALRPLKEQLTIGMKRSLGISTSAQVCARHARRLGEDSFQRVDLRFSVRVVAGWLNLDLMNITDAEYADVTGARAPGRALFLGFTSGS